MRRSLWTAVSHLSAYVFLLAIGSSIFALSAKADYECASSCSLRCRDIVAQYEQIALDHHNYCDGPQQPECILNCVRRYSDGSCRDYGPDYCGRDPHCVVQCSRRYSDGTCRDYDTDFCAEGRTACVSQCVSRYSDGTCRDYGADVCGRNPSCVPNCIARWPDGSCRDYGADRCVN